MTTLAYNKRANFDYQISDKYEAGLVLTGQEVKSVRAGQASLQGAYVTLHQNDLYLINANVPAYKMAGPLPNYDPTRSRKLLLNKKEIHHLTVKLQQIGLTLIPLSLYTKHKKIKLELALAKGKKKFDKRRTIKEREEKRNVQRALKTRFH